MTDTERDATKVPPAYSGRVLQKSTFTLKDWSTARVTLGTLDENNAGCRAGDETRQTRFLPRVRLALVCTGHPGGFGDAPLLTFEQLQKYISS